VHLPIGMVSQPAASPEQWPPADAFAEIRKEVNNNSAGNTEIDKWEIFKMFFMISPKA
jgi:hypothetical protein